VADHKPPRLAGGEGETLHALLQFQRESLLRKVSGVDEESARWSPVASGTSLLWLISHMASAEVTWVLHRFAGQRPGTAAGTAGDHPPGGTLADAVGAYQQVWPRVDAVAFAGASLDELCRHPDASPPASLRWVLMHLLEETARHAGHADILRELIDGATGRLPAAPGRPAGGASELVRNGEAQVIEPCIA
jgi:hypothetical protein